MAGRLIFTIVAVLSVCCLTSIVNGSHNIGDMKESEQRHWNQTVTKMVNATSKVADTVENVLNRTADAVFIAANVIGDAAGGLTDKLSEKLSRGSNKWAELKNRSAEKMANVKEAEDKIHDKLAAGVGDLIEKGNQLVNLTVGIVGQVVGKVIGSAQQVKSKVQEHKSDKMFFVQLPSKMSPLSARIVNPAQVVVVDATTQP